MSNPNELTPSQAIETFGELIAQLVVFAAKVPASSFMANQGGLRPSLEAIEAYETTVYRFREKAGTIYRTLNHCFLDSLEAFEAGRVFDAVPLLLQAIEQLVALQREEKVQYTSAEQDRIREFHQRLEKILPETTKPEVDLPRPETY